MSKGKHKDPDYYIKRRITRRAAGLCMACPAKSAKYELCDECRRCRNLGRQKAN